MGELIRPETPADVSAMQRRARQYALDHEHSALQHAADAQAALDAADYSRAATSCHRAHQSKLQADVLRAVLVP